ncbi:aminotransferase-like domain-containing protein [Actinomadura roseirufa]|uniref:aminotransferase-like domain-containing protein n=1 Tax=Actinomadura roseirufa TaxID=2094049 RepID=UPI001041BC59|nr:aminotransferase class I/II-fold pyridoxal phosphate-dependent enzyme [Actinomadura roseirufa]
MRSERSFTPGAVVRRAAPPTCTKAAAPSRDAGRGGPPRRDGEVIAVLSALEQRLDGSTARALASAVADAVADGALRPGSRLPPIRVVARELVLSPTTVSSAWALLCRWGLLRTDGRRGTTVRDSRADQPRYRQALSAGAHVRLDLSTGLPDGALLPSLPAGTGLWDLGAPSSCLDDPVLPGLAERIRADWPYDVAALTLTHGSLDALDSVFRCFLAPGDRVVVEHPTSPPVIDMLDTLGVSTVGVPLDEDGPDPAALKEALRQPVSMVVLQARAHCPTGVSTTPGRAAELARLLAESRALVVEEDPMYGLYPEPPVTLGSWLPHRTVHIRGFAKGYGPELRIAAVGGSEDVVSALGARRRLGQGWTSRLLQRLLDAMLRDEATGAALRRAGAEYDRRRATLTRELSALGVPVAGRDGLNVWVPVADESAAVAWLDGAGIGVSAGSAFMTLAEPQAYIRVTAGLVANGHAALARQIAAASRYDLGRG